MLRYEMAINGELISCYGARLINYTVGGTPFTNNTNATENKIALPRLLSRSYQPKLLTVNLMLTHRNYDTDRYVYSFDFPVPAKLKLLQDNKARLDKLIMRDEVEIELPDAVHYSNGYIYRAVCKSIGDLVPDSDGTAEVTYTFNALQCYPLTQKTIYNGIYKLNNEGCVDCECIIEATNRTDVAQLLNFRTFGFKYSPLQPGETLIINGFDGTLTVNGKNVFNNFIDFTSFPRLPPGEFDFYTSCYSDATDAIEIIVKFYPTFI